MKTNFKNFAKVLLMAVTIFSMAIISSCSKDGEPGKDGSPGVNGTNGQTGTANVIYSPWINQNWNSEDFSTSKRMSVSEPKLTYEFIQSGTVLGFFRMRQNSYFDLPYELGLTFNFKRTYTAFTSNQGSPNPGTIFFYIFSTNGTTLSNEALNGTVGDNPQYRYIMIPGGVSTAGRITKPEDYTKMSYQEICTKFNIPE
jgi:hypothetical protein